MLAFAPLFSQTTFTAYDHYEFLLWQLEILEKSLVIEKYPCLETHIGADADVAHSPHFESAIIKLQDKKLETLTDDEEAAILCLKIQQTTATAEAGGALDSLGSVESLLKKRKLEKLSSQAKCAFQDSRYLLATSNTIERFLVRLGMHSATIDKALRQ